MTKKRSNEIYPKILAHDLIAASAGIAHSMTRRGICYLYGEEIPVDFKNAIHWLEQR